MFSLVRKAGAARGAHSPGQADHFQVRAEDRDVFVRWARTGTTPVRLVTRSAVVLLASAGWTNSAIAEHLGISRRTVALWKTRYRSGGLAAVAADAPGRGRKPGRDVAIISSILETTRQPPVNGSRWTVRTLASVVGVSHATVQRVWREHGITAPRPLLQVAAGPDDYPDPLSISAPPSSARTRPVPAATT